VNMRSPAPPRPLSGIMVPQWLRPVLQGPVKLAVQRVICGSVDRFDRITGKTDPLIPPARLRVRVGCFLSFIKQDRYREVGREFARHLKMLANLGPGGCILDLGCGCGQVAGALVNYLSGSYEGIDPDAEAIDWCRTRISARYPKFQFRDIDFFNGYYNAAGTVVPRNWTMPFPPAAFDVVLLKSVFTHMLRADMEHYLSEIVRVLRPGGRCLASVYLLNNEVESLSRQGRSDLCLPAPIDGGRAFQADIPEYIVGWYESTILEAASAAGLRIVQPVHYGSWCGRRNTLSYQDLIVLERDGG
jgi:SAM-dependent methyltransferase